MIELLVTLLVLILILWAIATLLPLAQLPAPINTVIWVLVVVVVVIWFASRVLPGRVPW